MFVIGEKQKQLSNFFVITALCTIMVFTVPQAFASPGVGSSEDPSVPVLGGTVDMKISATGDAPMVNLHVRVYEPGLSAAQVEPDENNIGQDGICDFENPDTNLRVWDLRRSTTPSAEGYALFDLDNDGDFFIATFGDGSPSTVTFSAGGSAQGSGNFFWYDVNGGGAGTDTIDELVPFSNVASDPRYRYVVCGAETSTQVGDSYTSQKDSFFTQKPVGGSILSINTTALLIAGMSSNALWLAPLAAVAAGAFAVLRFQVSRR